MHFIELKKNWSCFACIISGFSWNAVGTSGRIKRLDFGLNYTHTKYSERNNNQDNWIGPTFVFGNELDKCRVETALKGASSLCFSLFAA